MVVVVEVGEVSCLPHVRHLQVVMLPSLPGNNVRGVGYYVTFTAIAHYLIMHFSVGDKIIFRCWSSPFFLL